MHLSDCVLFSSEQVGLAIQVGGAHEERVVASDSQWKLQRVLGVSQQGFDETEKQNVDD
jgi:hypothetical protein